MVFSQIMFYFLKVLSVKYETFASFTVHCIYIFYRSEFQFPMQEIASQKTNMCCSRKYPYPHYEGNWKFQRGGVGGGGQSPRKISEGRRSEWLDQFPVHLTSAQQGPLHWT